MQYCKINNVMVKQCYFGGLLVSNILQTVGQRQTFYIALGRQAPLSNIEGTKFIILYAHLHEQM